MVHGVRRPDSAVLLADTASHLPSASTTLRGMTLLQTALDHWHAGRRTEALDVLLHCWSHHRNTALAEVIDAVSQALDPEPEPFAGRTVTERRAARLATVRAFPPPFERIAATWPDTTWQASKALLDVWAREPDPRLARIAARTLNERPWKSRASEDLYMDLLRIVGDARDVRSRPPAPPARPIDYFDRQYVRAHDAAADWTDVPLAAAEAPALAAWQQIFAPSDPRALLAAVYANPDDDAPRAVYADALVDSDPHRGTFINLQLQATDKALAAAGRLRKTHGASWIPAAIQAVTSTNHTTFTRGFVSGVTLVDSYIERIDVDDPAWNTVLDLEVVDRYQLGRHHDRLLAQSWFRDLHTAFGCTGCLRRTRGEVRWTVADLDRYDDPALLARMPDLLELHLDTTVPAEVLAIVSDPACPALRRLVLHTAHQPSPWSPADVAALPAGISELRFVPATRHSHRKRSDVGHHTISRDDRGRAVSHTLSLKLAQLVDDAVVFADAQATKLTIDVRGRATWTTENRAAFDALVARYPNAGPVARPWGDVEQLQPKPGLVVEFSLEGDFSPDVVLPWLQAGPFGWTVDTLAAGRAPSRLQKNALAHVKRWRDKQTLVTLTANGDRDRSFHFYPETGAWIRTDGFGTPGFTDRFQEQLATLLRRTGVAYVCTRRSYRSTLPRWRRMTGFLGSSWLTVIGPALQRLLPVDGLLALEGAELLTRQVDDAVWLVRGETPIDEEALDDDAFDGFADELARLDTALDDLYHRTRRATGMQLMPLVHDRLGARLDGLTNRSDDAERLDFRGEDGRTLRISLDPALDGDTVSFVVDVGAQRQEGTRPANGPADLVDALDEVLTHL